MSPAVTGPGPFFERRSSTESRVCISIAIALRFSRMSTTSSWTPSMLVYSWSTPSISTSVTAQPGIEESSTRLSALPRVWPKPRSKGSITMRAERAPVSLTLTERGLRNSVAVPCMGITSLRIELDDQVLVDVRENLAAVRQRLERAAEFLVVHLDPVGPADLGRDRERGRDAGLALRLLAHGDHVAGGALVRGHVDGLAVHLDRLVRHELARLGAGRREAHPVHDVVEAPLEEAQQVLAGRAGAARGLRVVVAELPLQDAVHAAQLLLLAQLHAVARQARAALALDAARRHLELALALERLDAALQQEVGALAARELALGTEISGHCPLRLRRAASWAGGNRCAGSASRPRCS